MEIFGQYVRLNDSSYPDSISQIAFLPISFFKTHVVKSRFAKTILTFESSGTTGQIPSRHFVADPDIYRSSLIQGFEDFWGNPSDYCILALLPSYLERGNSSLVFMVNELMQHSQNPNNGFYLNDLKNLSKKLEQLEKDRQKTLLIGVTYALLELAEQFPQPLLYTTIIETGGMKGKREMVREELHGHLRRAFDLKSIASEYGMTEMLSQGWSKRDGIYHCPPWMRVYARPVDDPFGGFITQQTGRLHVIDLANRLSCAFIATDDLGKVYEDGSFEVLGRVEQSDLRGCNLLVGS